MKKIDRLSNTSKKMLKNRIKEITVIMLSFAVAFTVMPIGEINSYAASYWRGYNATASGTNAAVVSWSKLKKKNQKKINGIAVFRNGAVAGNVSKKATSFTDTGLADGTTYTYQIKTYKKKVKKTKMWKNKKTGQLRKKKPSKKDKKNWKRKTVKKVSYKYKNASPVISVTTAKKAAEPSKPQDTSGETGEIKIPETPSDPGDNTVELKDFALTEEAPTVICNRSSYFKVGTGPITLNAVLPGTGFTAEWTSSNTDYVTVSSNSDGSEVTLTPTYNVGSSTITGTIKGTSDYNGPKTISFDIKNTVWVQDESGAYTVFGFGHDENYEDGATFKITCEAVYYDNGLLKNIYDTSLNADRKNYDDIVISDPSVAWVPKSLYKGNVYFVKAGKCSIYVKSHNKTYNFIVSGEVPILSEYFEFVRSWPEKQKGKSEYQKVFDAVKYISETYAYGSVGAPWNLHHGGVGDCIAGESMLEDLLWAMDIENKCAGRGAKNYGGDGHTICKVMVNGVPHMCDATPLGPTAMSNYKIRQKMMIWEQFQDYWNGEMAYKDAQAKWKEHENNQIMYGGEEALQMYKEKNGL